MVSPAKALNNSSLARKALNVSQHACLDVDATTPMIRHSPRIVMNTLSKGGRGKRIKKKRDVFSPKSNYKSSLTISTRSTIISTSRVTEWQKIEAKIRRQVANINFYTTFLEAYEGDGFKKEQREKIKPVQEMKAMKQKIKLAKKNIQRILSQEIDIKCKDDRKIPEIEFPEENDGIDVSKIYCSRCFDGNDTDENDILICDAKDCFRAYHQKCLIPIMTDREVDEQGENWFCHSCLCKINCLGYVNDTFQTDFNSVYEVFANEEDEEDMSETEMTSSITDILQHDSENDDEYEPSDSSTDNEVNEEPSIEELLYHSKFAQEDILQQDKRSMRAHKPKAFIPESMKAKGSSDVGRRIGRMDAEQGLCFGNIKEFVYLLDDEAVTTDRVPTEKDSWFILFDDGDEEEIGLQEAEEGFALAKREELYDHMLQENKKEEESPEELIVTGKRKRAVIDYRKLNDSLFADTADLEAMEQCEFQPKMYSGSSSDQVSVSSSSGNESVEEANKCSSDGEKDDEENGA